MRGRTRNHVPAPSWPLALALPLFAAGLLLSAGGAWAQDSGGTESVFRLGPTARGVGLGPAMVGMANDASALYWNPALLPHAREAEFAFSYNSLYREAEGASYQYFGMALPTLRAGGFGIGLLRLSMGELQAFGADGRPMGSVDYAETQLLFGYGYGARMPYLGGRVDLGLTAKIHSLELGERSTSGGMDLALAYSPRFASGLRVSYVSQNLVAPGFRLVEMEDSAPRAQRLGVDKLLRVGHAGVLELGLAYESPQFADARWGLGAEYRFQGLYTARMGVDNGAVSLGLGGRWRAYSLDFAYRSGSELGASQFLSLSWYFGESIENQQRRQDERRAQELEQARLEAVEKWRREEAERALEASRAQFEGGDLDAAERQLARAKALGADTGELEGIESEVVQEREEQTQKELEQEVREIQVREAEDRLRAALASEDPEEARLALEALQRLTGDHPMLPRFEQQLEQLQAGAVAEAAGEATRAEESGDWVKALQAWERVAQLDPDHAGPSEAQERWKAELEAARNDTDSARREAERAKRQLVEEQRYTVALERFAEGDLEAAERLSRQVLAAQPQHAGAIELLGRVEQQRLAPRPLSPQEEAQVRSHYLAGLAHFSDGDYEAAVREWERILEVDPGNEGARSNIAEAQARLARLRAAGRAGTEGASDDR